MSDPADDGDKCPGCDGPISPRYQDAEVCRDCYGTTDDPWIHLRDDPDLMEPA